MEITNILETIYEKSQLVLGKTLDLLEVVTSIGFFMIDLLIILFSNFFENMFIFFMLFEIFVIFISIAGSNFMGDRRNENVILVIVNYHVSIFWFIIWFFNFMLDIIKTLVEITTRIIGAIRNSLPI